ncbi:MAG: PAS domain-containing protein [Pirellulales bacterium]
MPSSLTLSRTELHALLPSQDALDRLPLAVYYVDAVGMIVRYNRLAAELWGREPKCGDHKELYCGAHKLYWADGKSLPHSQCPLAQALLDGTSQRNKQPIIERPDGTRRTALVNAQPLRGANGAILGAVNTLVDITEWSPFQRDAAKLSA